MSGSRPKRHHFVPKSFLDRFSRNGRVLVRWRGSETILETGTKNVAVECGLYEVEGSSDLERALSHADKAAFDVLRLISDTQTPPNDADRRNLAEFVALQLMRTPEERERILFPQRVAKYAAERSVDYQLMAEYLEKVHLGFEPHETEIRAALDFTEVALRSPDFTKDDAVLLSLKLAKHAVPFLLERTWTLEIARKPRFITSDSPVVIWRKPSPKDAYEGVGVANADEIRYPIDPGRQLVIAERSDGSVRWVEPKRVRACNADMALACHRFVVATPGRERQLQELILPSKRPVLRFNAGPLYRVLPDGTRTHEGEVLHTWVPRR